MHVWTSALKTQMENTPINTYHHTKCIIILRCPDPLEGESNFCCIWKVNIFKIHSQLAVPLLTSD